MRSLYESILDTDKQVKSGVITNAAIVDIVQCFHKVFGNLTATNANVSNHEWYVGGVNLKDYDTDWNKTQKQVETKIRNFFKLVGREIPGIRCSKKLDNNKLTKGITFHNYCLLLNTTNTEYESEIVKLIGSTLIIWIVEVHVGFEDKVETIRVFVSDDYIRKILCEICIK